MSHPLNTCREINALYGHVCGLPLDHNGAHLQDLGTATISWGFGWTVTDKTHVWPATTETSPGGPQ